MKLITIKTLEKSPKDECCRQLNILRLSMTSPVLISLASSPFVAIVGQELEDHEDEGQEPEDGEGVITTSLPRTALATVHLYTEQLLDQATLSQRQTEVS